MSGLQVLHRGGVLLGGGQRETASAALRYWWFLNELACDYSFDMIWQLSGLLLCVEEVNASQNFLGFARLLRDIFEHLWRLKEVAIRPNLNVDGAMGIFLLIPELRLVILDLFRRLLLIGMVIVVKIGQKLVEFAFHFIHFYSVHLLFLRILDHLDGRCRQNSGSDDILQRILFRISLLILLDPIKQGHFKILVLDRICREIVGNFDMREISLVQREFIVSVHLSLRFFGASHRPI